ncbi:MAG: hypothetical protein D6705_09130 [Deltaproteobacteria bacterium]|nr:MAG: hypothetical protein D6705_09130 [Deltaproteobacteria bacterium]
MVDDDLRADVDRLRHDLGKYVAWLSSNLPPSSFGPPPSKEAVSALRRDLLATRRDAAGRPRAAWEVFDDWVAARGGLPPRPELEKVAAAVDDLRAAAKALRSGDDRAIAGHLAAILAAQRTIRAELRALSRSLAGGAH